MVALFQTGKIGNMETKNRIVMAPMVMNSSDDSGEVKNFHVVHYATRAAGGVGTVIVEATAVERRGRISDRDLGIWDDMHIKRLRDVVTNCHEYGAKIGVQLAHAGRKCGVKSEQLIAASAIAFNEDYGTPKEMTIEEIETVIEAFKQGARRADEAGFDFVEIHGAHGYLINTFLSPLSNERTDDYGQDRALFLRRIVEAVRSVLSAQKPIIVRVSGHEYHKSGNAPEDVATLLQTVPHIDAIHVSSGGAVVTPIEAYPGYQIGFAQKIKEQTGVQTIGGGLVTEATMAEEIVRSGRCDYIFLARVLLRDPYWTLHAAKTLQHEIEWTRQYVRGK